MKFIKSLGYKTQKKVDYKNYDLIIHVGLPKSGSSAIQYFLRQNSKRLKDYGFFYPNHPFDSNGISSGHDDIARAMLSDTRPDKIDALDKQIKKAKKQSLVLLLSSEVFWNLPKQVFTYFPDLNIKVIGFYRKPIEAVFSNYIQGVKRNFVTNTAAEFCLSWVEKNDQLLLGHVLHDWINLFGKNNTVFYEYEKNGSNALHYLERNFLCALGISMQHHDSFKFTNKSINAAYSVSALNLKRLLNVVLNKKETELNNKIDKCLQAYSDKSQEAKPEIDAYIGRKVMALLKDKISSNKIKLSSVISKSPVKHSASIIVQKQPPSYSLKWAALSAFDNQPEIWGYIKSCIQRALNNSWDIFPALKLAEIWNIDISDYTFQAFFFNDEQINRLLNDKAELADALREIACSFDRLGLNEKALRVVSKAIQLRPKGPELLKLYQKLKSHQSSLS